jgi:hypothetical protein
MNHTSPYIPIDLSITTQDIFLPQIQEPPMGMRAISGKFLTGVATLYVALLSRLAFQMGGKPKSQSFTDEWSAQHF